MIVNESSSDLIKDLAPKLGYLGLLPQDLTSDEYLCEKNIKYSNFIKFIEPDGISSLSKLVQELNDLTTEDSFHLNNLKLNINKIYNYCFRQKNEWIQIKDKLKAIKDVLEETNSKKDFEFLSLDNFNQITNSFVEEDPLINDLIINLKNLDLGDICRTASEITITSKLLKQ